MQKAIVCVTNDLATDQRVNKTCLVLQELGYEVLLVGRKLTHSLPIERSYETCRMKLFFTKGFLFYAEYNLRLLFLLLFKKADLIIANDLDTLLASYLISRLKSIKLVYDSHEYFCYVPELESRPSIQKVWLHIEKWIFPKLKKIITVNESIAERYFEEYGKKLLVIRNVPSRKVFDAVPFKSRAELGLPQDKKIILIQGSGINLNRGAEEAVDAMKFLPDDYLLLIIGGGDVIEVIKSKVKADNLSDKVKLLPKILFSDLIAYTRNADLGLTLDKPDSKNYLYSLPNKLFDYIHSGIPLLASGLPEIEKVFSKYSVGLFIESHHPQHIAEKIKEACINESERLMWKENLKKAAQEYNWENESVKLEEFYRLSE
jgi:glycosyltransferase involved in cell wall biosynthesis